MRFLSMNRNVVSCSIFKSKLKPVFCRAIATAPPPNNSKFMFLVENRYRETTNYSVICEKNLWRSDYPYRPFPENGHAIVGSCNGLFLVSDKADVPGLSLWNPNTNDFKTLPRSQLWCPPNYSLDKFYYNHDTCGFGFDYLSNDYKAIRFLKYGYNLHLVELYSLNSNSWKQITFPECHPIDNCVHINGVCYWLATGRPTNFVLSFDFANEKFSSPRDHIPLPQEAEGIQDSYHELVEFDGSLAVFLHRRRTRNSEPFSFMVLVWDGKSWSSVMPKITLDHVPEVFRVVGLFQKRKLFLQGEGPELLLFDCEKRVLENLGTNHDGSSLYRAYPSLFRVYPYVESSIPLTGK